MTGDLGQALKYGISGMSIGMGIGGAVGAGYGYKYAIDNGISPWTGKSNTIKPQKPLTPYQKVQEGVNRAIEELKAQGGKILKKEVTLEVNGVRVRVDIAVDFNGEIHLVEVKNGPHAGFTPNQNAVYPHMQLTGESKPSIIPVGAHAASFQDPITYPNWQVGQPTTSYYLLIIHY
jgi:hypothetical protein